MCKKLPNDYLIIIPFSQFFFKWKRVESAIKMAEINKKISAIFV